MSEHPRILAVTAGIEGKRNPMVEALKEVYGAEVLPGKANAEGPLDRVWRKLGLAERIGTHAQNLRDLNRAILERAGQFDILFVVKGNFVTAETLQALRAMEHRPQIIGWTPDDIYLPHNNSSVLLAAAPHYDVFYTAKSLNITQGELTEMGFRDARFLHQGYDRNLHKPHKVFGSRYEDKVVFIGCGEADRFHKLNYLAKNGVEVHVWGNGWPKWMKIKAHENLHIHGYPLLGSDYVEALSNAKISLCFLRKLNRDLHTSRSFEIPACGGFLLAERTDEHREYFEEDREAVYFDDDKELIEKVQWYLKDEGERKSVADAGLRRSQVGDYSYHRLAREIIESVWPSINDE